MDQRFEGLRSEPVQLELWEHGFPGVLATFCGLDGSGKTTTIEGLRAYVESCGRRVHVLRMPSNAARNLDYFREWADDHRAGEDGRVDVAALFSVLLGDRLLTVRKTVLPLLAKGDWVICDRYLYTAFAQLAAIGCTEEDRGMLAAIASRFPRPDLPFVMDVRADEAIRRIRLRPEERDTKADTDIFARFMDGYRRVAELNGVHLLPTRALEETAELVRTICAPYLERKLATVAD